MYMYLPVAYREMTPDRLSAGRTHKPTDDGNPSVHLRCVIMSILIGKDIWLGQLYSERGHVYVLKLLNKLIKAGHHPPTSETPFKMALVTLAGRLWVIVVGWVI